MRDFLIGESYDLFKNIYHSLDIRALLVKKDSRWRSLFCMVSASIDNLETVREIRNRKSDLGFKNPTGAEILLTVKRFDELPIILTNFRDGYLKVDKQKAKIFNSNFSNIDSCIIKQSYAIPTNQSGYIEMIGDLTFDNSNKTPLTYLKENGYTAKDFDADNLNDLKDVFDLPGLDYAVTVKFIFPIPFRKIEFKEENKIVIFKSRFHSNLLEKSTIRLQAANEDRILRRWEGAPITREQQDHELVNATTKFDISSYTNAKTFKVFVQHAELD